MIKKLSPRTFSTVFKDYIFNIKQEQIQDKSEEENKS